MLFQYIVLVFCLMSFQQDVHVSSCDYTCTDTPVLTPSRLVVKYGDPTSATCSVCQSACNSTMLKFETALGVYTINGTMINWTVDKMTEWDTTPICLYNSQVTDQQCCSNLTITVYKPPDSVSISISNHTGPMLEGHQYTLQCSVHNVAPIENLTVTFYRGHTPLGPPQSKNNTEKKPVNETYTLSITASKEDDGVQYWCEAKLELGPEGPQPPPVVKSQNISTTVHYNPYFKGTYPHVITITKGRPLKLNCSAVGNPPPTYTWMLPGAHRSSVSGSVLTIDAVTSADHGQYSCNASNFMGNISVAFNVDVQQPPDSVSISISNHTGPMLEGHQYTLQCSVHNVAPIENLTVTFYRGHTPLGPPQSKNNTEKKPVNETYTLSITASKEDDGVQYWCEAKLELGPEGPQPPPVVKSQNISTTVHYNPYFKGTYPHVITITKGRPLKLNCSAVGNPPPTYTWMLPGAHRSSVSGSVLTIDAVTSADHGQYSCNASNFMGNISVAFNVDVQQPPDSVSISISNHTGPMLEGHQYTLQCSVHNVAPIENLTVTFYRGHTPLGPPQSKNNTEKKPVNETYTLSITASKEDDGVQYWCEAKLELGPEGPQPPPVVKSQNISTTVHCLTSTRPPPTTPPNRSTSSKLIHRFTLCSVLLMSVLV